MQYDHAREALYWGLVLARLEALHREMEAMRPAVDEFLRRALFERTP